MRSERGEGETRDTETGEKVTVLPASPSLVSPSPLSPSSPWPLIALIGGAVAIGFAPIFVRMSETAPVATAFWRLLLAQPILWLWFLREKRASSQPVPSSRFDMQRLALVALFFAGDLTVWHWSIKLTSVANATLLANFAPVFVVLFSWLLWKHRVSRAFFGGMAVALCGVFLLLAGGAAPTATGGQNPLLGNILGLLTAAFYAGYMLSVKEVRGRFSTAAVMAWSGVFNSVFLLITALVMGGQLLPHSSRGWTVIVALALVSHVGGQSLIAYALAHLPATFSSIGLLVQPVAAALFAWILLGEAVGWPQFVGGALVLTGIILARRESQPQPKVD